MAKKKVMLFTANDYDGMLASWSSYVYFEKNRQKDTFDVWATKSSPDFLEEEVDEDGEMVVGSFTNINTPKEFVEAIESLSEDIHVSLDVDDDMIDQVAQVDRRFSALIKDWLAAESEND